MQKVNLIIGNRTNLEDKIPERRLASIMGQNNRRFTERPHQLLIGVVIVVAVIFLIQYNWYSGSYPALREKYNLFKECFKAGTEGHDAKTFWDNYGTVANRCESLLGLTTSRLQGFKNRDETKYHILPIDSSADSIILSLGIGHDADAEKALKPALSEASIFIGADPDITNHDVYRVVGTYLPMAVGKDSGNVTVNHLMHMGTTGYASGSTFMITLTTLIKEYLPKKTTMIDDIWVDIEYSEYKILDLFYNSADIFREGYSVCQFNLEAHWPNDEQKTVFHNFTKQLLEDGRYAFVKVSTFAGHWRILFVDHLDKRCADKYLLGN